MTALRVAAVIAVKVANVSPQSSVDFHCHREERRVRSEKEEVCTVVDF